MDQHMNDSGNLDGSIEMEFDHNVEQSTLETCLVNADCENSLSQIESSVELGNMESHIMMETEGGDYLHAMSSHDMPILGGEEEIMSDNSHQTTMLLKSHALECMDVTTVHAQDQESILSQITHGSQEPMLSHSSKESEESMTTLLEVSSGPMLSHSSQECLLSQSAQGSNEPVMLPVSSAPMQSQGSQETMLSQGSRETILFHGSQETVLSHGSQSSFSQEPLQSEGSSELILSQESRESLLSQGPQKSILLSRSQESNVLQDSQNSLLLPGSQQPQVVKLPQVLQDSILSQITGAGQSLLMSRGRMVPQLVTQTQLQLQLTKAQAPRTSSTIKQIAIAPKPHPSIKFTSGAKLASMSGKQFTLAPKPVQLVARKPGSSIVKKIAVGNGQAGTKSSTVLGSYGPGKQLVLVPSTSGGPQRLKLVQGGSVQYIKTEGKQILQPQVITTKKLVSTAAPANKQVMTKVVLQGGESGGGAGRSVLAKVLGGAGGAGVSGARFISLQQAQQLGIISCSTTAAGTKLVPMSPGRPITSYGGRMGKARQPAIATVKSPSKIVPALVPQGSCSKKVVSPSPQVVLRTTNQGTPQIVKLESPKSEDKTNSLLTNVTSISNIGSRQHFQNIFNTFAAKSIVKVEGSQSSADQPAVLTKLTQTQAGNHASSNPQIHQISVPGKGVQYVRLVSSQSQSQTCTSNSLVTSSSSATSRNSTINPRTVYNIPSTNTLLLPDAQGGTSYLQMATSKLPVPPLVRGTSTAINKLTSKPQQKLVRIAPVPQQLSQASTTPTSSKNMYTNSSETVEEVSLHSSEGDRDNSVSAREIEDSKASLKDLIAQAVRQNGTDPTTLLLDSQSHIVEEEVEQMEHEEERESEGEGDVQMEDRTQHVFMLPAYMQTDKELSSLADVKPDISPFQNSQGEAEVGAIRPRKPCNCTKSQCLKLYCDCFSNGEFCNQCNCNNCFNNLDNEEERQKAIRSCLDRNPSAFRPKIGKAKNNIGPEPIRRHNKGCNCKRSGCLKNYCECYEAKIACSANCKCVGCRNVEDSLDRSRRDTSADFTTALPPTANNNPPRARLAASGTKQPCSFMTSAVIDAVCACLLEAARDGASPSPSPSPSASPSPGRDPVHAVLEEFARCIQDIITASCQAHLS